MKPQWERYTLNDPELLALVSPEMDTWLNSWTAEENATYAGQYIAVGPERAVVASDSSASGLQRKLRKLGRKNVRVFLMEPLDVHVIYAIRA